MYLMEYSIIYFKEDMLRKFLDVEGSFDCHLSPERILSCVDLDGKHI